MDKTELHRFLGNLRYEEKTTYRKNERTYLKVIDTTKAITFNDNCIREKLCPKSLYRGGLTWRKCQMAEDLLRQRNVDNLRRLDELEQQKRKLHEDLRSMLSEDKLREMGVDPSFVSWITDYLTERPQFVRLGNCVSGTLMSSTDLITAFSDWSHKNHLLLNTSKTKEMILDFRMSKPPLQPVNNCGVDIEVVPTYE